MNDLALATGILAQQMAELARTAIGPEGLVVKVSEADAGMARAVFVSRLGEAALKILDGDTDVDGAEA